MWHVRGQERDIYTGFWWGDLVERDRLQNLGTDVRIILKCIKWFYRARDEKQLLGSCERRYKFRVS